jgi:hypothetical protein
MLSSPSFSELLMWLRAGASQFFWVMFVVPLEYLKCGAG